MQSITIFDYILLPVYVAFFYWRAKKMGAKLEQADLKKYLFLALTFRMLGAVAYGMLIQYYYGYGDSLSFYRGGSIFTNQIIKNPSNISYLFSSYEVTADWQTGILGEENNFFYNSSNNFMMRISAILSFLSFGRYLIIALFFGFLSFLGQWKLFLVFDEINQRRHRKLLAFVLFCLPSIWFWSSGLLKDSICLGSMGYIVYILHRFFIKKIFSLANFALLGFLCYVVLIIKSYIIFIFLIGFAVMLLSVFFTSFKNIFLRAGLVILSLLIAAGILAQLDISESITNMSETGISQIKQFQNSYQNTSEIDEDSKAGFGLGEFDPSIKSLLVKSPLAIFTTLYRPFPWESRKIIIFLASLETMSVLIVTLFVIFRTGFFRFWKLVFSKPYLLFCFTISILFALLIGFTTFNFGTMIRYKVIFLPFFYFLLIYIFSDHKKISLPPVQPIRPA